MTNVQRNRLINAVTELNAAMLDVRQSDADATTVWPALVYGEKPGELSVSVDITTGRETIGPPHGDDETF